LDDSHSDGYAQRVNEARVLSPGPFSLRLFPAELRTPSGRGLNLADLRKLLVFAQPQQAIRLEQADFEDAPRNP
jgi:hypothetical protein